MTPPQRTARATQALELAREVGFDLAGLAPLRPPRDAQRFRDWLEAGYQADMAWLERNRERILDPGRVLHGESGGPGCLLVVGLGHARPAVSLAGGGRIARYAAGRDYHNRMGKLLRKLARRLNEAGLAGRWRGIVDAGPILERSHAAEAGLGFLSKAANLLNAEHGPWFFLGELLLDVDLTEEGTPPPSPPIGSCGTCRACLDACPTDAIRSPGVVDSGRCISYQTIENRGSIPRNLRAQLGDWVFGCDICSEVCPWGSKAHDRSEAWGTHAQVEGGDLIAWLRRPSKGFSEAFQGSPLSRAKRDGLARNAAIALGNHPRAEGPGALIEALEHESAAVREAAGWALTKGYGADRGGRAALERAWSRELDPTAKVDLGLSLDRTGEENGT